jgi:uncharacterized protein YkwD
VFTRPWLALGFAFALALVPLAIAEEKKEDKKDEKKDEFKLTADEQAIIDLTNAERKKEDLPPLKMNPKLMEAARAHAKNMADQDKLDHVLDEKDPVDRAKVAGYKSGYVGENIAWNQKTAKAVLETWMDSEGHRKNILTKEFEEIGVAVVKNKKGEPYWVQVFGKP